MSSKAIFIHGGWGLAAIAAFFVGSMRSEEGDESSDASRDMITGGSSPSRSGDRDSIGLRTLRAGQRGQADDRSELSKLFGNINGADFDALAVQAFKDPNPITRRLAFSKLLESMTAENALELRDKLVDMKVGGSEWRDFHYSWGAIAGQEAFDHAANSEEQDLAATMSGWAAANPTEAVAMLDNLPESMAGQRMELAESVVAGLADHDLSMATALAVRLAAEGKGNGDRMIRAVADEALRSGSPAEAASWAEALGNGPVKAAAMDRVAGAYVRSNPEEAASWIGQYAGEEFAGRAVAEVGEEWGERAPEKALGWLESLPDSRGQADGFSSVLGDWEDTNPVAASEYLARMAPSPQRDAAVAGFARGYAWQDPQAAIAWAQDISDPALRQQSLTQAGQAYYRRDPESARTWLQSSGLPAEAQQQVLNPRRR